MTDILCTVIGNRGHRAIRQSSRASGMSVVVQSHTERIALTFVWNKQTNQWQVVISKDNVVAHEGNPLTSGSIDLLWDGTLSP